MRAVVQRVSAAQVRVGEETVGSIDSPGLLVLIAATHTDTVEVANALAAKIWQLRIMDGEVSCADLNAPILVVSQFTLYGNTGKGRRPSWAKAAPGPLSEPLVEAFISALIALGATVETGRFGALMEVELINQGPMTILIDTDD